MLDSEETFIGQTGHIYIAPVGTAFPASIGEAVDTDDWTEIGYVDTDGVQFNDTPNFQAFHAWQKRKPIRMVKGDVEATVGFNLQQWNADTIKLAFGGGEVTEDAAGEYRYTPPAESEIDEHALIVEAADGTVNSRRQYARVLNQAATSFSWSRAAMSLLPVEFMILSADGDDPDSEFLSDSPSMAPTGS